MAEIILISKPEKHMNSVQADITAPNIIWTIREDAAVNI